MIDALPKAVIVLIEGAAMGGGVGLVAVSDWAIAEKSAQIGTPEVTVGLVPAQIAPFVVARIGYAQARRMATYGLRLDARGRPAHRPRARGRRQPRRPPGQGHGGRQPGAALLAAGGRRDQAAWCAPRCASRSGPRSMRRRTRFAAALAGDAREGIRAFVEKRKPAWVEKIEGL